VKRCDGAVALAQGRPEQVGRERDHDEPRTALAGAGRTRLPATSNDLPARRVSSAPTVKVSMLVALLGSKGVVELVDTEFNARL
jgi:hypothetical protein